MEPQRTEGKAPFHYGGEQLETWYCVYGDLKSDKIPLLVLHGGPALSHDYLLPLADLASGDHARPVVFYDQVGNSRSTIIDKEDTFWTIDLFVDEVLNLVQHLGVHDAFDVVGHSWGGILASELVIRRQPSGLQHVILEESLFSRPLADDVMRARAASIFSPEEVDIFWRGWEGEELPQFPDIIEKYLSLFGNRVYPLSKLEQFPPELAYSLQQVEIHPQVDRAMRKYQINPTWDITDKLSQIEKPVLVIFGHFSFLFDRRTASIYLEKIPRAKFVEFMDSSHIPHFEQRDAYMQVVRNFLEDID